jgi:hypothetical protein
LHGAAATGLLVASIFYVAEIGPPPLAILFTPTPSPIGDKSAEMQPEPQAQSRPKRKNRPPATVTQPPPPEMPTETPSLAPVVSETPPTSGPGDGQLPGDDNGHGPGDANGLPGSTGPVGPSAPAPSLRPKNVGPHILDNMKIAGAQPHLPDFVRSAHRGLGDTPFVARLCVDQAGAVSRVDVLQGIAGADETIVQTLRGWRYKPQPIPVCFVTRLIFEVN